MTARVLRFLASPRGQAALVALAALLASAEAHARVGGGEGFGTGRGGGGGGGGYGGGGGGGGDGDLVYLLVWLLIRQPEIGVPLVLILGAVFLMRAWGESAGRRRFLAETRSREHAPPPRARPAGVERLRDVDPAFSYPVLLDHLQLVHRRATEAAATKQWDALVPFVAPEARQALEAMHGGVVAVSDVVLAAIRVVSVDVDGAGQRLVVAFQDSRVERVASGERHVYVEEQWTFRRGPDAVSLPPDRVRRMGCPSCGAAIETDAMGRCRNCGTPIADGRLQWQAVAASFTAGRVPLKAPDVAMSPGGEERSVQFPTRVDPTLGSKTRAFLGRHPDFAFPEFEQRVRDVYFALQSAWSAGRWEGARPFCTDTEFQSLRFWMDRYAAEGRRNRLDDVALDRVQVVKIDLDAWYEAITVRLWGSMRDYVVDRDGRVVGGNDRVPRRFSEYWTFLRTAGTGAKTTDPKRCPSCGAPLDRVDAAGICGYCDTKITTGDFDWVLSRIDQAEVYAG